MQEIAKYLNIRQNVAGVTFVACGNGVATMSSSIAAISYGGEQIQLGLGALFGVCVFNISFICATICLIAPNTPINPYSLIRDACYLIIITFYVIMAYSFGETNLIIAGMLLIMYTYTFCIWITNIITSNRLLGANIGNYTIVSLSLAGNQFDITDLSNILSNLYCCICLDSLNISENITKQNILSFGNHNSFNSFKKNKNKHNHNNHNQISGPNILGHSLVNLCRRATKLERLIMKTNDLSVGLEPFLAGIAYLSNLKFIDLSNNKFNDKHIGLLIQSLSYNRTFMRALKINQNKITSQCLIVYPCNILSNIKRSRNIQRHLPDMFKKEIISEKWIYIINPRNRKTLQNKKYNKKNNHRNGYKKTSHI